MPCEVIHGGERAFYSLTDDKIRLPNFSDFKSGSAYYATRGHESVHWTGHASRCNREFGKRFGDDAYAFEELIAELGAAMLSAVIGIDNEPRQDHAHYLKHWVQILKSDKKAIFAAASKSQAAVDYLAGFDSVIEEEDEEIAALVA